jgi:hypothetical protein
VQNFLFLGERLLTFARRGGKGGGGQKHSVDQQQCGQFIDELKASKHTKKTSINDLSAQGGHRLRRPDIADWRNFLAGLIQRTAWLMQQCVLSAHPTHRKTVKLRLEWTFSNREVDKNETE